MSAVIVRIVCIANGEISSPHDGRFVVEWDPHTPAGELVVVSTADPSRAKRFESNEYQEQWSTISRVEPVRPWDGRPNRPLSVLTIETLPAPQ